MKRQTIYLTNYEKLSSYEPSPLIKVPCFPAVLRCALFALSAATLAAPQGRTSEVGAYNQWVTPEGNKFGPTVTASSGPVADSGAGATWNCFASANFGFLSAKAFSSAPSSVLGTDITTRAHWFDQIVIASPGVPDGTIGDALVTFYFDGTAEVTPKEASNATPTASISYRFAAVADGSDGQADPNTGSGEGFTADPREGGGYLGFDFRNLPRQHSFSFRFGQPIDFTVTVQARAKEFDRYNAATARAEIRCNGYNGWDAVYVRGSATPVTNYTVSSTTGGFNLAVPTTNTFSNWTTTYNLTGANAAGSADPNGNGLSNTLEYAFGLNPSATGGSLGTAQGTVQVDGKLYQTFSHTRPARGATVGDFSYSLERATSLGAGDWTASPQDLVVVSVEPGVGNTEIVTVRSTHPITETAKEYLRLKVTTTSL